MNPPISPSLSLRRSNPQLDPSVAMSVSYRDHHGPTMAVIDVSMSWTPHTHCGCYGPQWSLRQPLVLSPPQTRCGCHGPSVFAESTMICKRGEGEEDQDFQKGRDRMKGYLSGLDVTAAVPRPHPMKRHMV